MSPNIIDWFELIALISMPFILGRKTTGQSLVIICVVCVVFFRNYSFHAPYR